MPRIRSVKPELWQSPQVMNLSLGARCLFIGLITQADDFGRGSSDLRKLKASIFPGDDCGLSGIQDWLDECSRQRLVILYAHADFGDLYALPTWDDHQYVPKRADRSRYPAPPRAITGKLPESSGNATVGSEGSDLSGKESLTGTPAARPTTTERATRLPEDFGLTAERRAVAETERLPADRTFAKFCDYWRSASGSKARKTDWDATWRNWCRNEADRARPAAQGGAAPMKASRREPTEAEIAEARRKAATDNHRQIASLGLAGALKAVPQ